MIQKQSADFLLQLSRNNTTEWFKAHAKEYEAYKKNYRDIAEKLIPIAGKLDSQLGLLLPKECQFRINRDIRFSANKSPYKTNLAVWISPGGKKSETAGYYFHWSPEEAFTAAGLYMPSAPALKKIREDIDLSWEDFQKIVSAPSLTKAFAEVDRPKNLVLKRCPKGFSETHPGIEWLKLKSFTFTGVHSPETFLKTESISQIEQDWKALKPFVDFLNRALQAPDEPEVEL
jgi:uncharacterized protein (TIGR02453 family)